MIGQTIAFASCLRCMVWARYERSSMKGIYKSKIGWLIPIAELAFFDIYSGCGACVGWALVWLPACPLLGIKGPRRQTRPNGVDVLQGRAWLAAAGGGAQGCTWAEGGWCWWCCNHHRGQQALRGYMGRAGRLGSSTQFQQCTVSEWFGAKVHQPVHKLLQMEAGKLAAGPKDLAEIRAEYHGTVL